MDNLIGQFLACSVLIGYPALTSYGSPPIAVRVRRCRQSRISDPRHSVLYATVFKFPVIKLCDQLYCSLFVISSDKRVRPLRFPDTTPVTF